mmetsp:Transcript_99438/g.252602  ORF Transcript_99438/g.252602 Transcript_99438/m.252602 type:complete len:291 (-) Transcript_99438:73-945(-)
MGNACTGQSTAAAGTFVVHEAGFSIPVRTTRKMGWKRDLPDFRDRFLTWPVEKMTDLPPKVDLRPAEHFHIYDQGALGSCTANAIGAAFHFAQIKEGVIDFTPSRLFIYYNERAMEGSTDQDAGAFIRDGVSSLTKLGVCDEKVWAYKTMQCYTKPSTEAYTAAQANLAKEYARVDCSLEALKTCINEGFPFAFGFTVMSSFQMPDVAVTGVMHMPMVYDSVAGGHAVLAVGYDDSTKRFIVRNSWGAMWGDKGYFYMPYAYISNPGLCDDFWAIKFVEGKSFPTTTRKL